MDKAAFTIPDHNYAKYTGPCEQDEPFSGSCDTVRPQYYYSATQDRCLPFDGCQATRRGHNSYNSLMMCRDTCMGELYCE